MDVRLESGQRRQGDTRGPADHRARHGRRNPPGGRRARIRSILYHERPWHRIRAIGRARDHPGARRPDRSRKRAAKGNCFSHLASAGQVRSGGGGGMIPPPTSVLYTQDPDLARRLNAYLRATAQVRHVTEPDRLEPVLRQTGPAVVIMDLRASECRDLIGQIQSEWPEVLIVALGTARSEPLREAGQLGIYAAEDLELERRSFQALAGRAFDYLNVLQENRDF